MGIWFLEICYLYNYSTMHKLVYFYKLFLNICQSLGITWVEGKDDYLYSYTRKLSHGNKSLTTANLHQQGPGIQPGLPTPEHCQHYQIAIHPK